MRESIDLKARKCPSENEFIASTDFSWRKKGPRTEPGQQFQAWPGRSRSLGEPLRNRPARTRLARIAAFAMLHDL